MLPVILVLASAVGLFLLLFVVAQRSKRRTSWNGDGGYTPWMYADSGGSSFGDSSAPDCSDGAGGGGCDAGGGDGGGGD